MATDRSPPGDQMVAGRQPGGSRVVARSPQVHLRPDLLAPWQARGAQIASLAMKTPLWIALTLVVVLGAGSGLAVLNQACKTGHHTWCAPESSIRHHVKAGT